MTPNYTVIDTDYDNYSLVYTCNWFLQKEVLYILSRNPTPSDEEYEFYVDLAASALPKFKFDSLADKDVQGETCSYRDLAVFH
mmetsp:Transcript_17068/g.12134  ORF Transcript_17068/g.12134 Transcript_17068/m.12134 type:complete len:83 (+) Transcript_17068:359-607(+)|eukprot:CAMPEP_0116876290 /NCGR_PEP_ID=MMETSP0463-20121206/8266_1 /TAXON_ID=181622 /ORGANISM="Strombidinopsis sp, Strain SopsisLIS2011" /LENGTH=82 /DNA_ID=CAMNT_0004522815 /DNA_START=359 /DNA_END=607 /DNA_ORIENTATION=-